MQARPSITDFATYKALNGKFSLCFCVPPSGSGLALIRKHDEKLVITINFETLDEEQHPSATFFSNTPLIPLLVDDMAFMVDPEGAQATWDKQIQAEEKCGFFRPE